MSKKMTTRNHVERREFGFKRGDITLNFKLRVDIKEELKDFLELLKEAISDVEETIKKVK